MISDCIKPIRHLSPVSKADAPGSQPPTWTFEDNTVTVYPVGRNNKSMRVIIIRRKLTRTTPGNDRGTVFHVCRNCGKWGYRIEYRIGGEKRVTRSTFQAELRRMGATEDHVLLMRPELG